MKKNKLSEAQKRIFYTQLIHEESCMFNIGGTAYIKGKVNSNALKDAVCSYISSKLVFHSKFTIDGGEMFQYYNEGIEEIEIIDFSLEQNPKEAYEIWLNESKKALFRFENTFLYKIVIAKLSEEETALSVKIHHIIADGWSLSIFVKEISRIYSNSQSIENNEKVSDEADYDEYIISEDKYFGSKRYIRDKQYWNEKFKLIPDNNYYSAVNTKGNRLSFYIDTEKSKAIEDYCEENNFTYNAFFIGVYNIYEFLANSRSENIIGVPVLGRRNRRERDIFGMCVNILPIMSKINEHDSLNDVMKYLSMELNNAFRHQLYPYNRLLKDLGINISDNPLYNVSINYYGTELDATINDQKVIYEEFYNGEQEYLLQIIVKRWNECKEFYLDFDYLCEAYDAVQIKSLFDSMMQIVDCIIRNDDCSVSEIKIISGEEEEKLTKRYNDTFVNVPNENILDLYARQVQFNPDKIAVKCDGKEISYLELDRKSNGLAKEIQKYNLSPRVIGLEVTHSIEAIIAILAILKSGCAFVPIDPLTADERRKYIIENAKVSLVITNCREYQNFNKIKVIKNIDCFDEKEFSNDISRNSLAYIIYTSGTTGTPKGVMIEHKQLMNYIVWAQKAYSVSDNDVFPLYSSLAFDLTITSIFVPLISGASIIAYEDNQDEYVFNRIIKDNLCTIMKVTPAHLRLLDGHDMHRLKITRFIVGGENLPCDLARKITESFKKKISIFNEYGPTESTVGCMIYEYDSEKDIVGNVPIGKPSDNVQIYIFDKAMKPCPIGVIGEMYIGGESLSRGYLYNDELTNKSFAINPYTKTRLYKTGDLAKFVNENCMICVGRTDSQVKIRGHRVELGEIENVAIQHDKVNAAVALIAEHNGSNMIVLYYCSSEELSEEELYVYLYKHLNNYMLPSKCISMKEFPLTINGKIDRGRLPEVFWGQESVTEDVNLTDNEQVLYDVITSVLDIENISMSESIINYGSDSIKAIQISSKLRNLGYQLKVADIMSNPIPRDMIMFMKQVRVQEDKSSIKGKIERTPIIEWFDNQQFSNPDHYLQSVSLRMKTNEKSLEFYQAAMKKIVKKHDILRARWDKGVGMLEYRDFNEAQFANLVSLVDLRGIEQSLKREKYIQECVNVRKKISLNDGGLITSCLFINDEDDITWFITAHHLVIDGISWQIILEDLSDILNDSFDENMHSSSFGLWTKSVKNLQDERSNIWDGYKANTISIQPKYQNDERYVGRSNVELGVDDVEFLLGEANNMFNTTTNELLIAATSLAIYNYFGCASTIYTESHGRNLPIDDVDITRTVGWFTYFYPLDISASEGIKEAIISAKEANRLENNKEAFMFGKEAKQRLEEMGKCVCFNYLGKQKHKFDFFDVEYEQYMLDVSKENVCPALLELNLMVLNNKLCVSLKGKSEYINDNAIDGFVEELTKCINLVNEYCMDNEREWTESDIASVDISLDELNNLFE